MANRRMFHRELVSSDKFIDMPASTQLLFFHLGINADDEGFVSSPKRIQRMVGCGEDDLKILLAKNFIVGFDSGVVVITDWNKHNQIRKDRFVPTLHAEEKQQLQLVDSEQCQPNVNQMSTMGKPSIVEVSLGKVSSGKGKTHTASLDAEASEFKKEKKQSERDILFEQFWEAYGRKGNKKTSLDRFKKLTKEQVLMIQTNLPAYLMSTQGNLKYRKNAEVYLNPAREHWNDVVFIEQPDPTRERF
jgi:hypothetical protein